MKLQLHLLAAAGSALALSATADTMLEQSYTLDVPHHELAPADTPAVTLCATPLPTIELPRRPEIRQASADLAPGFDPMARTGPGLYARGFDLAPGPEFVRGFAPLAPVGRDDLRVSPPGPQFGPGTGVLGTPVEPGSLALGSLGGLMMVSRLRRGA